jgi:hypothetical protein
MGSSVDTLPQRRETLSEASAWFHSGHISFPFRFPDRLFELPDETESRPNLFVQVAETRGENAHPREHYCQCDNDDQETKQKECHHEGPR